MITGKKLIMGWLTALLLLTAGCGTTLTNLTPRSVPANPSRTYTLSVSVNTQNPTVPREAMKMYVVVDGERREMRPSLVSPNVYEYDYKMAQGQSSARYFYVMDYYMDSKGAVQPRQVTSDLQELVPLETYVVLMELSRAPIGARVTLSGSGFSPTDTVLVGNVAADTEFLSPTSIAFRVPALTAGRDYQVSVRTRKGVHDVGPFRIDATDMEVFPTALKATVGQRAMLVVTIPNEASSSGVPLDITTDIPTKVAIPNVAIPAGSRSINVPVEGLAPGKGILRIQARGFRSIDVPVWVE